MSRIVGANGRPLGPKKLAEHDLITVKQARELAMLIATDLVIEAVGPLAKAFEEMRAKVARLEDRAGITDATVQTEERAQRDAGGDLEC